MHPAVTPPLTAADIVDGVLVASIGSFALFRITSDHYRLMGPDSHFSKAWLIDNLPISADWQTAWAGDDELTLEITRPLSL